MDPAMGSESNTSLYQYEMEVRDPSLTVSDMFIKTYVYLQKQYLSKLAIYELYISYDKINYHILSSQEAKIINYVELITHIRGV